MTPRAPRGRRIARRNRRVDRRRRETRRRLAVAAAKTALAIAAAGLVVWHGVRFADVHDWLDPFRVREVRVVGVDVANPTVLVAEAGLMGADLRWWSALGGYAERVERDPLVAEARLRRRFPNRLTLEVVERRPVAFLALDRLAPADSTGRVLPVSAFQPGWDVPVMRVPWPAAAVEREGRIRLALVRDALSWLGEVGRRYPALAREISAVELDGAGIVTLRLVHAEGDVVLDLATPIEKLALVDDVLRDLHEKGIRFSRLDLRFEDQIVVRRG